MRRTQAAATTVAAVVALLMLWLVPAQSAAAKHKGLKIDVLSTRADLISGGEALVAIRGAHSLRGLKVKAAGKSQTKRFQLVDGTPEGVVKGLARGRSRIVVRQGRKGARLRVTNHPSGGPVFSGPQLKPWKCQATARRTPSATSRRRTATSTSRPTERVGLPALRPAQPALGRRDHDDRPGRQRCRSSSASRRATSTATSTRSPRSSSPASLGRGRGPQPQFNHKLLITHGVACGADHQTGDGAGR